MDGLAIEKKTAREKERDREKEREREIGEHGRASFAAGVVVNTSHVYAFFISFR